MMAAAMAFAAAKRGRRVVVLTGLSEASAKLIAYVRSFAFFDKALVGDQVQVLSLTSMLVDGVPATADQLVTEMRWRAR